MSTGLPLHPDGCIRANIPVQHYIVLFEPKCEHAKMRGAMIAIDASSAEDAMLYATRWIRLAQLVPVSVREYEPGELTAIGGSDTG